MIADRMEGDQPFLDDLLRRGVLIPGGVAGVYGRGALLEALLDRLAASITRRGRTPDTLVLRFPPVISRQTIERCGYLHTFPQLAGSIHTFRGGPDEHARLTQAVARGEDWGRYQTLADVALTPAACYAVYPQCAGELPVGGRLVDVESWCYRHEPSPAPERLRAFRMREFVRLGAPEVVRAWRDAWLERGTTFLRSLGLDPVLAPAADPFFGPGARLLAASQREQQLKFELLAPVGPPPSPTAVMSCNIHREHFGEVFAIHTDDGETAHTACVAFGMERLALALIWAHGPDPADWPAAVRAALEWEA